MTSYSNINDAFNITEYDELDKMAREYNNKKNYNNNDEYDNYSKYVGNNYQKQFHTPQKNNKFHFFSTQGTLTDNYDNFNDENSNTDIENSEKTPYDNTEKTISNSPYFEQDSKDSFILSLQNNDKKKNCETLKLKKKYDNNINKFISIIKSSHQEESSSSDNFNGIMDHIKTCNKCKKKFKSLMNENNHVFHNSERKQLCQNQPVNLNNMMTDKETFCANNNSDNYFNIFESDIKNVIIAILVGIGIIFILDIFWRSNHY